MRQFVKAYIKSMRLYYAFITGIAGWIGVAFYEYSTTELYYDVQIMPAVEKKVMILTLLFLGWGLNQIFNDYLGVKEDRINAPYRPMVTGELNPKAALIVSISILILASLITFFYLEPIALIPLLLGVGLNIVYEYAKGYGILGNIVFGLMISTCTAYGFLASGPIAPPIFTPVRVALIMLVVIFNSIMTYYTYFKDYEGDKAAGKNTIVVKYGIEKARWIGLGAAFLPAIAFTLIYMFNIIPVKLNNIFWILAILTLFLEVWTGYLYFKNPIGKRTYHSLATNFKACACGQATIIAVFNDELAIILFLISYIFIGFLFDFHQNRKA